MKRQKVRVKYEDGKKLIHSLARLKFKEIEKVQKDGDAPKTAWAKAIASRKQEAQESRRKLHADRAHKHSKAEDDEMARIRAEANAIAEVKGLISICGIVFEKHSYIGSNANMFIVFNNTKGGS